MADPVNAATPGATPSQPSNPATQPAAPASVPPTTPPAQPAAQPPAGGAPAGDPSQAAQPAANPKEELWEQRFAKLQSAKDREVAAAMKKVQELEARLQTVQPQTAQPQPTPANPLAQPTEPDVNRFLSLINSDKPEEQQAALRYLRDGMMAPVQQQIEKIVEERVQRTLEMQESRKRFVADFEVATSGFSEAEKQSAVAALQESYDRGYPITPQEAALIGRFGSVEQAMKFATQVFAAQAPQGQGAPPAAAPAPRAPFIPGSALATPQAQPGAQPPKTFERAYNGLL